MFSEIFKKHTLAETEEQLYTGTTKMHQSLPKLTLAGQSPGFFHALLFFVFF